MRHRVGIVTVAMSVLVAGCAGGGGTGGSGSAPSAPRTTPALPAGWKAVNTKYEIAVDVPADWPVVPWTASCGVATPTVYIGPQGAPSKCTTYATGAEVVIGAFAYQGAQKPVTTTINGMTATEVVVHTPYAGPPAGTVTSIWVRLVSNTPTGVPLGIYVVAGESADFPGGGPGMAAKIVSTIHGTVASS